MKADEAKEVINNAPEAPAEENQEGGRSKELDDFIKANEQAILKIKEKEEKKVKFKNLMKKIGINAAKIGGGFVAGIVAAMAIGAAKKNDNSDEYDYTEADYTEINPDEPSDDDEELKEYARATDEASEEELKEAGIETTEF